VQASRKPIACAPCAASAGNSYPQYGGLMEWLLLA
jgi:hypothetical protein